MYRTEAEKLYVTRDVTISRHAMRDFLRRHPQYLKLMAPGLRNDPDMVLAALRRTPRAVKVGVTRPRRNALVRAFSIAASERPWPSKRIQ